LVTLPEEPQDKPCRKAGEATVYDVGAFCDALNKHKVEGATEVFADGNTVVAVLNAPSAKEAGHCDNMIALVLRETEEWKAWQKVCREGLTQLGFAEFIDQYIHTIASPDGAVLARVIRELSVTRAVQFRQLDDGSVSLTYTSQVNETGAAANRGAIQLPTELVAVVRLHIGEEPTSLRVRVRFRLDEEQHTVRFGFFVRDLETVQQTALDALARLINVETGFRVWRGTPWRQVAG
jgi:uncharacterized protein YfdQ (DUF2303 family)